MATGNLADAMAARANTFLAQQRFNVPMALAEVAAPATPNAGLGLLYQDTDGRPRVVNDSAVVYDLGAWRRDVGTTHIRPENTADSLVIGGTAAPAAGIGLELQNPQRALLLSRAFDVPQALGLPPDGTMAYDTETHTVMVMINGVWTALGVGGGTITLLGQLGGRDQDVLPNHVFAPGRGCCQIIAGGAEAAGDLIFASTSHSVKGNIFFGASVYDEANQRLGIGTWTPLHTLDVPSGTIRLNTGWTGVLRADAGLLSIDSAGGGGGTGWSRNNTTGLVYPTTTTDKVAIGATTITASALLELVSTSLGFLPPRMTTAQMNAISTPAEGLIVYDTTAHKLAARDNGAWKYLAFEGGSGGPVLLIEDLFTGTGALSTTTNGGSLGAVTWNAASGTFDRSSDQGRGTAWTGSPQTALWWVEASDADGSVEVQFPVVNNGHGVVFRYVDASNYWYLRAEIPTSTLVYQIRKVVGGTHSNVGASFGAPANNDTLKVTCGGTTITAFLNTVQQVQLTSQTDHQTATKYGLRQDNFSNINLARYDAFRVYSQ